MDVENKVEPTAEQIEELMKPGPDGPIYMVNLVKFKERAEYADGRDSNLSGRDAYLIYGRAVAELLPKFGANLVFAADVTFLTIGVSDELWDEVAIVSYPDRAALVAMSMSPEFQEISVHRSAGLAGQLNIESVGSPDLPSALTG